jgi:hypothetical protein
MDGDVKTKRTLGIDQSMANGILDQRLEQKRWHLPVEQRVRHRDRDDQAISMTDLFDLQVVLKREQFDPKRDLLGTGGFKGVSQQARKPDYHAVDVLNLSPSGQYRNAVQCVEKEVRVELGA